MKHQIRSVRGGNRERKWKEIDILIMKVRKMEKSSRKIK